MVVLCLNFPNHISRNEPYSGEERADLRRGVTGGAEDVMESAAEGGDEGRFADPRGAGGGRTPEGDV